MRGGKGIEDEFGTQKALDYLVGEKFLNFLEAAETDADFRAEIPAFVAEIKDDLRAVATGPIPGDGTGDGTVRPRAYSSRRSSLLAWRRGNRIRRRGSRGYAERRHSPMHP